MLKLFMKTWKLFRLLKGNLVEEKKESGSRSEEEVNILKSYDFRGGRSRSRSKQWYFDRTFDKRDYKQDRDKSTERGRSREKR